MRTGVRDTLTITVYSLVVFGLLALAAYAARDVLFERFTFRIGATVVGGPECAYVIGGRSPDGDRYHDILIVDPEGQTIGCWKGLDEDLFGTAVVATAESTIVARPPEPRDGLVAAAYGEHLIVIGGDGNSGTHFADILELDPQTGAVIRREALPFPLFTVSATMRGPRLIILATDALNRNLMLVSDLSVSERLQVVERPVDLDVRSSTVVTAGDTVLAIDGRHPIAARQLGIWNLDPGSGDAAPLRFHSRVWQ